MCYVCLVVYKIMQLQTLNEHVTLSALVERDPLLGLEVRRILPQ